MTIHQASTALIDAKRFTAPTGDTKRVEWNSGSLRHLIDALAGAPVIVTTDHLSGHTLIGAELVAVMPSRGHDRVRIRYAGGVVTDFLVFSIGSTIIPMLEESWGVGRAAERTMRAEQDAAIAIVRDRLDAHEWVGQWKATPLRNRLDVTFTPAVRGEGPGGVFKLDRVYLPEAAEKMAELLNV